MGSGSVHTSERDSGFWTVVCTQPVAAEALTTGVAIDAGHAHAVRVRLVTNDEAWARVEAARGRLPEGAVFSGLTAAWLHGLKVLPFDRIEFTIPKSAGVTTRSGMVVRRAALGGHES